jgi:hypothetical protein
LPKKDTWGTESGILDDFDFIAKEAWFGPNPESDYPDRIYLHLRGPAYIGGDLVDEEYEIRYATGDNWEVVAGGASVAHASGAVKFKRMTAAGTLVDRIIALCAEDKALDKALDSRDNPTDAATYVGLAFHFEAVTEKYTDRVTKEERSFTRQLPTAYLPDLSEGGKAKAKPAAKASAKPAAKAASKGEALSGPALRRAVKKYAAEYAEDDFTTFVDEVFDVKNFAHAEAIAEDDAIKEWILDETDGCWAEVHGE